MSFLPYWDSAFVPCLGLSLFDPSKAIVSPALASLLQGGKCGLCSPKSPALVGTSGEGLRVRSQSLAAGGTRDAPVPGPRLVWAA